MTWWIYGLIGALVWGLHYNLVGKALTVASPITVLIIQLLPLIVILPLYFSTFLTDLKQIYLSTMDIKISSIVMIFTNIIASLALYKAIEGSNATLASLIEISYPVFVALFAIILFKENHLDWSTVIGGLLVLSGTAIIIYHS